MSEPTQAQRAAIDGEGYLVDPEEWDEALAVELAKVQGIELTDAPAFSFQGHPEASPGPHDVAPLFDRFVASMAA